MTFERRYLLVQDGQHFQIGWRGYDSIENYIVLPVDPFSGEIADDNNQYILYS